MGNWTGRNVLVTGGASFIGCHLVDALVERGASVRVVDNLSSGKLENIEGHLKVDRVDFLQGDIRELALARRAMKDIGVVFHLAADHGGRGYVDLHQADCATNLALDGIVFLAAYEAGVDKVVFASSGCVYPNHLQTDPHEVLYLREDLVRPPYDADNTYGWAKLMGEITLRAYYEQYGLKSVSCRYFTVYGPRGVENHAVMALIARAFVGQDPYVVWGTGEQVRNWTYIDDIVEGTLQAAEKIEDSTPVNLGTMERIRVVDAVKEVLRYSEHETTLEFHPEMPTGPYNRVADNSRAKELLGWQPRVSFWDGLHRTIDWYFGTKNVDEVRALLDRMLTER
jgi:nucleoside-diphosphate-sugar epimerase